MTRILLVEDEPLFRKGLAKMIAESGTSWNVCGEAENGQEAERWIAELQPDLVITDIRMPLMDGLELLKRVKTHFPEIEVIVITGYQDFQYAQAALRYGALDLLVKPCSKQDMYGALEKVSVLMSDKQARLRKEASENQLLLENTIRAMMLRFPYPMESVLHLRGKLQNCKFVLFQITDYFPIQKQYLKRDVPLLQFAVLNIISEILDAYEIPGTLLLIESGRFALFVKQDVEEQALCKEACETIQQLLGLNVRAFEAGIIHNPIELPELYESLLTNAGMDQPASPDKGHDVEPTLQINRAKVQLVSAQMGAFLLAGQSDSLKQYLEQLMKDICRMHADICKIEALSLSFAMQETARKQLEQDHNPQAMSDRISKLHDCSSTEEVYDWMRGETDLFMNTFFEWQYKYSAKTVSRAIHFMKEHFSEQLSLQHVASQIHLNPAYFSHLFKKETGRSFVTYLIELRMEKAKQLLSNTDMSVTEISGHVGYDLPNYFAKLFKQFTGCSPKEYRKLSEVN
ncbi:response regulator [Paenibacillus sp. LMG 31458]|uniref:Response regulator n=1 Tax=Paenibacillus phytorum TaxID=2654977 RepID=A0ABX1XTP9_9BACL|nr:response regulator [Paenibacillus phytorum]NOU71923.1 response regulator [Paenibacillus phytorum]